MTEEDEESFKNNIICRYCERKIESDKVRDHCHLTGFLQRTSLKNL